MRLTNKTVFTGSPINLELLYTMNEKKSLIENVIFSIQFMLIEVFFFTFSFEP